MDRPLDYLMQCAVYVTKILSACLVCPMSVCQLHSCTVLKLATKTIKLVSEWGCFYRGLELRSSQK